MKKIEINAENMAEINAILDKIGISIQEEDGKFFMSVQTDRYFTSTNRKAGRKPKAIHDSKGYLYQNLTLDELYNMMKVKTAEEIAKELGISRRTLFRRIKLSRELESKELL